MLREVKANEFEAGAAFVEGKWVPLSEAKLSLFDWGFMRSNVTYDAHGNLAAAYYRSQR